MILKACLCANQTLDDGCIGACTNSRRVCPNLGLYTIVVDETFDKKNYFEKVYCDLVYCLMNQLIHLCVWCGSLLDLDKGKCAWKSWYSDLF